MSSLIKSMLNIKLLFFATLRDRTGLKQTEIEVPEGTTIVELKALLQERFPGIGPTLETALMSINREFAFDKDEIPAGAEIAIFPPVSGG